MPTASNDHSCPTDDPRVNIDNFVAWYNITYVGVEGSRAIMTGKSTPLKSRNRSR